MKRAVRSRVEGAAPCADIVLVDYGADGLRRYAAPLVRLLKERYPNMVIVGCFVAPGVSDDIAGIDCMLRIGDEPGGIAGIVEALKPRAVMVQAHRVLDYAFTLAAHRIGAVVFNFQHGLYMDETATYRVSAVAAAGVVRAKRDKAVLYAKCMGGMCGGLGGAAVLCASLLRGRTLYEAVNERFGAACNADISFVFGEHYLDYYRSRYLETHTRFEVIGYPELEGAEALVSRAMFENPDKPVVCYLAQASVEDGVVAPQQFVRFAACLADVLPDANILIKPHPRSDMSLFAPLFDEAGEGRVSIWRDVAFPRADAYIGHESTTVARALHMTGKVAICRFDERRPSPFEEFSPYVAIEPERLASTVRAMFSAGVPEGARSDISRYAKRNESDGALNQAARAMAKAMGLAPEEEGDCDAER